MAFVILSLWLATLFSTIGIAASDFLCVNLSTIASALGMSESLTGVTFLALGNGSPDVFSTFAAFGSDSASLAIGELLGAACFIAAVVAGSMALVRPFRVARRSFVRDVAFFILAAGFTLFFLADGRLYFWECLLMVLFYVFYVIMVVSWHWYIGHQRQQRARDLLARAHLHIADDQELDIEAEEDDDPVAGSSPLQIHGVSSEDFGNLEYANRGFKPVNVEDDESRDLYLTGLQHNMHLAGSSAAHPVRPSLVGALEFRSVLSSLRRSKGMHDSGRPLTPEGGQSQRLLSPQSRTSIGAETDPTSSDSIEMDRRAPRIDLQPAPDPSPVSARSPQPDHLNPRPNLSPKPSRSASPALKLQIPHSPPDRTRSPLSDAPSSAPSPFPSYHEDQSFRGSFDLPPPSMPCPSYEERKAMPFPLDILPSPRVVYAALFPTLQGWKSKTMWEKLLAVVSAPSVFVLTITLPVAEPKDPNDPPSAPKSVAPKPDEPAPVSSSLLPATAPPRLSPRLSPRLLEQGYDDVAAAMSDDVHTVRSRADSELPLYVGDSDPAKSHRAWNCWLLCIHLFSAPAFIALTMYVNLDLDDDQGPNGWTVALGALLVLSLSAALVAALLRFTPANAVAMPPRLRPAVSFLGFAVAVAWISTLAAEVVNLLKTMGVVLRISDSLLGLTVFAVGNSLGDLVADITVARLGYPVMALSACFGGPMMNVLLGIGVGGMYMTLNSAPDADGSPSSTGIPRPHPGPYLIDVSTTLLISGGALLLTLAALLVCVPLNRWVMDRRIGWALVGVWVASTMGNVLVEILSGAT